MKNITLSLNLLRPERAFVLKWLSADQLAELEKLVLNMTPAQYRLMKYGWRDEHCPVSVSGIMANYHVALFRHDRFYCRRLLRLIGDSHRFIQVGVCVGN